MKIQIEADVVPFSIPHVVAIDMGVGVQREDVPLDTLSWLEIDQLCREFREGVYRKAGMVDSKK